MKKKNSQVFVLENIPYTAGAPVVITSGCLVKDGGSGRLRCQLEMACVNDDPIRAVTVLITPTDTDGKALSPAQQQRRLCGRPGLAGGRGGGAAVGTAHADTGRGLRG